MIQRSKVRKTSEYHKCYIKRSSWIAIKMASGSELGTVTEDRDAEESTSKCHMCHKSHCIMIHVCLVLINATIMLITTFALLGIDTSNWIYSSLIFFLPPVFAFLISAVLVVIVGFCFHKPDTVKIRRCHVYKPDPNKLVRLIFPYIKRKDDNNVMFGFILTKYHNWVLLWVAIEVVFYTIWTFWFNIIITYSNNNNPHAVYSYEINCFYLSNYSKVELSTAERLTLEETIKCFAINSNIAGAMSQATGILAFTWILVAILTWTMLKINHSFMRRCFGTDTECSKLYYIVIHIAHFIVDCIWIAIILVYNDKEWYSFLATPENNLVIAVLLGSTSVIGFPIKKVPKSLEEHCREALKQKTIPQRDQIIRKYMESTLGAECVKLKIDEAIANSDEESMKIVINKCFENVS